MLITLNCEITHLDACIWISVPASKHWILIFSDFFFPNLLGIVSLQCWFPFFGSLGVHVASEGCCHDAQHRATAFYSPWTTDNPHLCIWEQAFLFSVCYSAGWSEPSITQGISTSSGVEDFLSGGPCQGTAGEGCKVSNTEAKSADMAGRKIQNGKKLLGFAQTLVVPPAETTWGQQWMEVHAQKHANRYAASCSRKLGHLGWISSFFFVCFWGFVWLVGLGFVVVAVGLFVFVWFVF